MVRVVQHIRLSSGVILTSYRNMCLDNRSSHLSCTSSVSLPLSVHTSQNETPNGTHTKLYPRPPPLPRLPPQAQLPGFAFTCSKWSSNPLKLRYPIFAAS